MELKDTLVSAITEAVKQDVFASLRAAGVFRGAQADVTPDVGQADITAGVGPSHIPEEQSVPILALGMLHLHSRVSVLDEATTDVPQTLFQSRAIPIDLHVTDDVRVKIVSNKYIDLDCLVPKPAMSNKIPEAGTFQLVDGTLKVVPSSNG